MSLHSAIFRSKAELKAVVVASARVAISYAGGPAKTARALNSVLPADRQLTIQAVERWQHTGIPPARCLIMETLQTKKDRYDMQPEVFGDRPA